MTKPRGRGRTGARRSARAGYLFAVGSAARRLARCVARHADAPTTLDEPDTRTPEKRRTDDEQESSESAAMRAAVGRLVATLPRP